MQDKVESQEELIKKLHQLNLENNELMITKSTEIVLERLGKESGCKLVSFDELTQALR